MLRFAANSISAILFHQHQVIYLLLRFAANSISAILWMRTTCSSPGCGLRPIRYLLYLSGLSICTGYSCGLRPIRYLLYFYLKAYSSLFAAVCGQFDICYTRPCKGATCFYAAVCGQFDICYTSTEEAYTHI